MASPVLSVERAVPTLAPRPPEARPARLRGLLVLALVAATYGALACLVFYPVGPLDSRELPGAGFGDPVQMAWFLAWAGHAVAHGASLFHSDVLDVPRGVNLMVNTSVILPGVLAAPVTDHLGPVASLNLLMRASLAADALALYCVLRSWCRGYFGPFVAGLVYAFSAVMRNHLDQTANLDLVFVPIPPLLAWCLVELCARRRFRAVSLGVALGVLATAQLLVDAETLSECALIGVVVLLVGGLVRRRVVRERARRLLAGAGACACAFGALAALPLWWFLAGPQHLRAPVQRLSHLDVYRTDLLEWVLPANAQLAAPSALVRAGTRISAVIEHNGGPHELGNYLGAPLVIVVLVVAVVLSRRDAVRFAVLVVAVAGIVSLGTVLQVDGKVTGVPLPAAALQRVPFLSSSIWPRYGLFVVAGAAVILALGLDAAMTRLRAAPAWRVAGYGGVVSVTALSVLVMFPAVPFASEAAPAWPANLPRVIARVAPRGSTVLTYPFPDSPYVAAMLWQAEDAMSFRLLGGYANVPSDDAARSSQYWPPLRAPRRVQRYLAESADGIYSHYGPPSRSVPALAAGLCDYLERQRVSTVVDWPVGRAPLAVRRLFTAVLGRPTIVDDNVEIWRSSGRARSCLAAPRRARVASR